MMRTKRAEAEQPTDSESALGLLEQPRTSMERRRSGSSLASSHEQVAEMYDLGAHNRVLEQAFPRVVPEPVLIDHVAEVIKKHGFTGTTAINLVSCCRDELCRPFTEYLDEKWGLPSFNIASLAGMHVDLDASCDAYIPELHV